MKKTSTSLALALLLGLSLTGCNDEMHHEIPRGPWKMQAKKHAHFETFHLSAKGVDMKKLRSLVAKANLKTPIYARILLNEPEGTKGATKHVTHIERELKKFGIAAHRIDVQYLDPASAAAQSPSQHKLVTVTLDQYELIPPTCPGWREYMDGWSDPTEGEAHFGCTNVRNMVSMIAEPRDAYEAHQKDASDGAREAAQIGLYRKGDTRQVKSESTSLSSATAGGGGNSAGTSSQASGTAY